MPLKCRSARVASIVCMMAVAAVFLVSLSLVAVPAQAASHSKTIRGHVYDASSNPIDGATVTISIGGATPKVDTTDANGFYSVTFLSSEWNVNDAISVVADYKGHQTYENSVADDSMIQTFDLHFEFEIPQFGSDAGMMVVVGLVGVMAVGVLLIRRR